MPKDKYDLLYIIDPLSNILLTFTVMISMVILFSLSFSEFFLITGVDSLLFMIVGLIDRRFFPVYASRYVNHFPTIDVLAIEKMGSEKKRQFVQDILAFPAIRTRWVFMLSVAKVIIPGIILVHIFSPKDAIAINWLRFWSMELFYILILFSGIVYTTVSRHCYDILSDLDSVLDLGTVFYETKAPALKSDLFMVENFTLFSSAFAFILLTWSTAQTHFESQQEFIWCLIGILSSGFISIGRVYYVNRRNFNFALRTIFARISSLEGGNDRFIPLHSDSSLANFENSFNLLIHRLKNRDREIESWMAFQAEQNKMANIGESLSLVTHDMVSPLHTIEFCVDELLDGEVDADERQDYLAQVKFNVRRVLEMVNSLKYSAKNPLGKEKESALFDAYSYTLQLLKNNYSARELEKMNFFFDPRLVSMRFQISHTNLIHLLYNTMKNSVENLLNNEIASPKIEVLLDDIRDDRVEFMIRDNGTGLCSFEFERMTSKESLIDTRKGLGMRLTKRIVERYLGEMFVHPEPAFRGTEMHVVLPRSTYEER